MHQLSCPFAAKSQIINDQDHPEAIPGFPDVLVSTPSPSPKQLTDLMRTEICTPDLNTMGPYLGLMTTKSSLNISSLHHQIVKGREIVLTESPELHLVWYYDRIFIKPIPRFLLSYAFWQTNLSNARPYSDILRGALGFLRSYHLLISHESDFHIAKEKRLIPQSVDWKTFRLFRAEIAGICDEEVSLRYQVGEIRLTRLNLYAKIFLRRFHFFSVHGQYASYFSAFYGTWLFVFAVLSLLLSTMQVEMSVESAIGAPQWRTVILICRWISVLVALMIVAIVLGFVALLVWMIFSEILFATKDYRNRRGEDAQNSQA